MLDRELVEAVKMARDAGAVLMDVYATDFKVTEKGDKSPITVADERANDLIIRRIQESFPNDAIVSEESSHIGDPSRGRCWYVDPLDGTKEFVAKNGEFSVMIGLVIDGDAKLGVVYQPVGDRLYRGVVGSSAFVEVGDRTYGLSVTRTRKPEDLRLVVSRSHRSDATDRLVNELGIQDETQSGSVGLKVGLITQLQADLYVHLSEHSWAWDACAPDAILRAAGGSFTDLCGDRFRYTGANLRNSHGILACNRVETLHELLPTVSKIARDIGLISDKDPVRSFSAELNQTPPAEGAIDTAPTRRQSGPPTQEIPTREEE